MADLLERPGGDVVQMCIRDSGTAVVDTLIHQIMRIKGVQRAYRVN